APLARPVRVAQLRDRICGVALEIMAQPQRMSDFVRDHVAQHFTDDIVRQGQLLRFRIQRRHLGEVPGLYESQDVMPEDGMRGDDFAAARIDYRRAHRILTPARGPAHDVEANVLRIPTRIFLGRRGFAREDGIAESCFLEDSLPVLDAILYEWPPFFRHLVADIEEDGLYRIRQFSLGVFLLQPVALDERATDLAVVVGAVI